MRHDKLFYESPDVKEYKIALEQHCLIGSEVDSLEIPATPEEPGDWN